MNEDIAENLLALIDRLQEEQTPILWEEAAELLIDFPGVGQMLSRLRYQSVPPLVFLFGSYGSRPEVIDPCLTAGNKQRLIRALLPYSFLLDTRYTILERACLIQDAGYDAVKFCEEIVMGYDGTGRFQDAAGETLLVVEEHQNLLRGSEKPDIPASELLRAAQAGVTRDDSLLHPSEAPPAIEAKPGLFARITSKLTGKK